MTDSKMALLGALGNSQFASMQNNVLKAQQLSTSASTYQAKTPEEHEKEIEKAGTQFEGLLVQEMLKEMWKTVPQNGLVSGSQDEQTYQEMFQQALANNIAEHRSIGIKDVIIRDIKATEERHNKAKSGGGEGSS